jgi:perosamine synthetase
LENLKLACPDITDRERELVSEVLSGSSLSGGPMLTRLESMMAERAERKHAVGVSSGTAALHLIVRGLGLGPGDAVITTAFSFVASANCLLFEGVEPVFVDIDDRTFNLDPELVRITLLEDDARRSRIKAILAVDIFGHPADWTALREIADEFDLLLIEDSAESLGSSFRGEKAGSFGDAGIFAFYPNKQVTTGEGGAVLTDDDDLAELCRSLRNQGRGPSSEWFEHVRLGYNYRLSELHAALGVAQFERLDEILAKRAQVAAWYDERLASVPILSAPVRESSSDVAWFVYVVRLCSGVDRSVVSERCKGSGIPTRPYFPSIHLMPHYREPYGYSQGDLPVTEAVSPSTLALPFHANMTEEEVAYVCDQLYAMTEMVDVS